MRIGVLSDTHLMGRATLDDLGPQAAAFLSSVDLILHAGDIEARSHLDWCEQFAPLLCARGNNDHFEDARISPVVMIERMGWRIGVVHDLRAFAGSAHTMHELKRSAYGDTGLDILLTGDSHYERLEYRERTLLLDTASPTLPHHKSTRLGAMGLLEVTRDGVHAEIVPLGETPGRQNPVTAAHADFTRDGLVSASIGGVEVVAPDGELRWRGAMPRTTA